MTGAHQPQQSVLNPHEGHRHTACMRNISVAQRSQTTASDDGFRGAAPADLDDDGARSEGSGAGPRESGIREL